MKKLFIPIMILAIMVAFYEETKSDKNIYIICIAVVIFMYGMLRLSSKTPSKNQDEEDDNIQ